MNVFISGRDLFRMATFFATIDKLKIELQERNKAYGNISNMFCFYEIR